MKMLAKLPLLPSLFKSSHHSHKNHLNCKKMQASIIVICSRNYVTRKRFNMKLNSLQHLIATHKNLDLHEPFSPDFFHVNKFDVFEMDIVSLYLAVVQIELEYCFRPAMVAQWERLRSKYCNHCFTVDAVSNSCPIQGAAQKQKRVSKGSSFFDEDISCTELWFL